MSSTGVPSIASSSATTRLLASTRSKRQMVLPRRLGRPRARCAKIPTRGHAGLPRGWRARGSDEPDRHQLDDHVRPPALPAVAADITGRALHRFATRSFSLPDSDRQPPEALHPPIPHRWRRPLEEPSHPLALCRPAADRLRRRRIGRHEHAGRRVSHHEFFRDGDLPGSAARRRNGRRLQHQRQQHRGHRRHRLRGQLQLQRPRCRLHRQLRPGVQFLCLQAGLFAGAHTQGRAAMR